MPSSVPNLNPPPASPTRASPSTFATRADAWVSWMETWAPDFETAAVASEVNASESYANAVAAQASANSVGAALWVSGTTYAIGDVRRSPANQFPYRRLTAGAGTTDPSADATNWTLAAMFYPSMLIVSATTQTASAWWHYILTNASATTLTLPANPSAGDVVWVTTANGRTDNVVERNAKNIMSLAENMTLNERNGTTQLRYADTTRGWIIV
jgi:hypothetical protein